MRQEILKVVETEVKSMSSGRKYLAFVMESVDRRRFHHMLSPDYEIFTSRLRKFFTESEIDGLGLENVDLETLGVLLWSKLCVATIVYDRQRGFDVAIL